jgi:lipid A disaccharide synthetase
MPNIIAEKEICTELLAEKATPRAIAESALDIMQDPVKALTIKEELKGVRSALGEHGASLRAAQVVLSFISL